MAEQVVPASLSSEVKERYLRYALSVIRSRALPDVRDGLKPVQRRILYTMFHDLHLVADGRPRKCAKIVGDVTGNYHPHGTSAAYEALVRMAQDFVLRNTLVQGQGNFGSVGGDAPAAERYTEAKLTHIAECLMTELRQRTVGMQPNYDNTREEPVVLPAQFPNLLVNGVSGIAVGMATNIPPHNLGNTIRAACLLIENPEATTALLLDKLKGPDFPLGGRVVTDRVTLRKIYEEGTGSIRVQGEWKLEENNKRTLLVITSVPYGVDTSKLVADIGAIIAERKLTQALDVNDESNGDLGLRITMELKSADDANIVMAYLYRHTDLQHNFAYNMTCLVPVPSDDNIERVQPERLSLKKILRYFLDFRLTTVRRRFEFELDQLKRRIHILEAFKIIFNDLDRALKMIRESNGKADAAEKLRKTYKLDDIQADAILDAQIYKIAQLEIKKILDELKEKKAEAARISAILASEAKLWEVVKTELEELGKKFTDRQRTRINADDDTPDYDPDAYITRENANVVLTREGWIKRVGRLASVEGTRTRETDAVLAVVPGSTHDHVMFFADDGTAYTMRIHDVPASSGYGEHIAKFFKLGDQVKMVAAVTTDERFIPAETKGPRGELPGPYLLVVTAFGQILRTPLVAFRAASTRNGRRYVRLQDGDRVVLATVVTDEPSIFLASASGHVIHFPLKDVRIQGVGQGVMGISLEEGDTCLGGTVINPPKRKAMTVVTAADKEMDFTAGKYEPTTRGGKGFLAVKRTTFARVVPPPIELVDWETVETEAKTETKKRAETNGHQKTLF
jgi:DNA gyrase subunit A